MPQKKKLLWTLFQSHLLITLFSLATIILFAAHTFRTFYAEEVRNMLTVRAQLFEKMVPGDFTLANAEAVNRVCGEMGAVIGTRFTAVLPNGVVIGDSEEDYRTMDNHSDRPEIISALSGETGIITRYSYTLRRDLMYVAVPLYRNGDIIGIVRTSMPVTIVSMALRSIYLKIALVLVFIGLVAATLSFLLSRKINSRIVEMIEGTTHFSQGDLAFRIAGSDIDELEHLAEKMNDMAALLDERIHTVTDQRNEIEAILSGMIEGVIALDNQECVVECNESAEKLFDIDRKTVRGKNVHEVIRNIRMQKIVNTIRAENDLVEDEIVLHKEAERILQVHGNPFSAAGEKEPGMVLVFNDITRLKRLETVRRDFVSNVSHELKTPITSIIGFVETLKTSGGGKEDDQDRFLDIILKNSRRLNSIVEDLLSLSRIEQETERRTVVLERNEICSILSSAVAQYETPARKKNITIGLNCDTAITIRGNASLLVQAVGNLIDNAIKYSARDTDIQVSARREESSVIVEVQDNGNGIPREHLPRIFERFYRVDKSRSRDLGGTGLGLAIVKHIVLAHGGRISVDSMLGKGSTFTITLPAA